MIVMYLLRTYPHTEEEERMVNILDLEPGDQFQMFISKSMGLDGRIHELVRFEEENNESIPISTPIATYWTYEKEWKEGRSTQEERWNPYCEVVKVKFSNGTVEYL